AVQHDFAVGRQIIGYFGGQAYAQIHHTAFRDVLRNTRSHLVSRQSVHFVPPVAITRWTNSPGVTMVSGSSSPSSTMLSTCATATRAAVAMMGPKLRAVLRYTRLPQRSARKALISA